MCAGTAANTGDYTVLGVLCQKTVSVVFTIGTACSLNGLYSVSNVKVGCGAGVAASDCPLTSDANAAITFRAISNNLCASASPSGTVNNAVQIDQFIAPDPQVCVRAAQCVSACVSACAHTECVCVRAVCLRTV